MTEEDKKEIDKQIQESKAANLEISRSAWRSTSIAAIGSLAFFASMLINVYRTWNTHGNPAISFQKHDYVLVAVPILVVGYVFLELSANGKSKAVKTN